MRLQLLFIELFLGSLFFGLLVLVFAPEALEFDGGSLGYEEGGHAQLVVVLGLVLVVVVFFVLISFFGHHGELFLLAAQLFFRLFLDALRLRVGTLDDSQGQIQQEIGTNEDQWHKEEEHPRSVGLLVHDHDLGPALERDALEHVEQGPEDVVKVGDVIVRVERALATKVALWALLTTTNHFFSFFVEQWVTRQIVHASLLEHAHEEVEPTNSEDQKEEEQHNDRVLQQRDSRSNGRDHDLQTLDLIDETEWSEHTEGTQGAE